MVKKKKMPETMYRSSRYFRVLGNPTAYMILKNLEHGRKTPSELSAVMGKALSTISTTLRHLRQVDLVRYKTIVKNKEYWIKDTYVLELLKSGEKLAEKMRGKKE